MPAIHQQLRYLIQWEISWYGFDHLTRLRHLQSQKLIAFAIFTWSRLKEPHEYLPLLVILQRLHVLYNLFCRHLTHNLGTKIRKIPDFH